MKNLYLDLETIPAQRQDVIDEIRDEKEAELKIEIASIKPPGNYKKMDTIQEWWDTEAPRIVDAKKAECEAAIEKAYRSTGLDGSFGQIAVIGFAFDDEAPQAIWSEEWDRPSTERELIEDFYNVLAEYVPAKHDRMVKVIGHNVLSFDLRFLTQRSTVFAIKPPDLIRIATQAKPWEDAVIFDTMTKWSGQGKGISLDKLCKALSVLTPKTGITGATVWDWVQRGCIADVAAYCKRDIVATREVHRAMTFTTPVPVFEDLEV